MNWKIKAVAQRIISALPGSGRINYWCQRHLTKSVPHAAEDFYLWVEIARNHLDRYERFGQTGVAAGRAVFYEFGAGWDMIVPLTYYFSGVSSQILTDVRPLLRAELIADSLHKFKSNSAFLKSRFGFKTDRPAPGPSQGRSPSAWLRRCGIDYRAPVDARNTGLAPESVDFVSSTYVLEHVPENDIAAILLECYRILKKGGIFSCEIDYKDHYADFDPSISIYHFLRYSDPQWSRYNSSILHQNRLRHRDFLALIRKTPFILAGEKIYEPTESQMNALTEEELAGRFKNGYSLKDLGVTRASLALKK